MVHLFPLNHVWNSGNKYASSQAWWGDNSSGQLSWDRQLYPISLLKKKKLRFFIYTYRHIYLLLFHCQEHVMILWKLQLPHILIVSAPSRKVPFSMHHITMFGSSSMKAYQSHLVINEKKSPSIFSVIPSFPLFQNRIKNNNNVVTKGKTYLPIMWCIMHGTWRFKELQLLIRHPI